jgi:hypothetical protein
VNKNSGCREPNAMVLNADYRWKAVDISKQGCKDLYIHIIIPLYTGEEMTQVVKKLLKISERNFRLFVTLITSGLLSHSQWICYPYICLSDGNFFLQLKEALNSFESF